MPKLAALCRICVVGDMATGAQTAGEAGAGPPTEKGFTGKVCAWASGTLGPGKKGLATGPGERTWAALIVKDVVTAGVTGDHGELQASEQAQGDIMLIGEVWAKPAPSNSMGMGSSNAEAPALCTTARLADIWHALEAAISRDSIAAELDYSFLGMQT
mmetsp:Transcript_1755/g.5554  ORF Transcript_1755/g.5554 Transcript_1755/m.5554 type:complete len:158 (+) Transcript_1755:295-768(+)